MGKRAPANVGEAEESIYRLIPPPREEILRPPMYRTNQSLLFAPSCSTFGLGGSNKIVRNQHGKDLQSSSKKDAYFATGNRATGDAQERLPPIVPTKQLPLSPQTDAKKKHEYPSSDVKLAVHRKSFGKPPKYLQRIKNDIAEETTYLQNVHQPPESKTGTLRQMSEDEKTELLAGLKKKWDDLHQRYQRLPFRVDTISHRHQKEVLEAELQKVEKAMDKLSKPTVLVYDDTAL
eukprot:TRINITY_DN2964_c0_g1_i1.p1 TRINITY_DN2964_c0_g1~~TRINITY_DN2964_c0_g1_i1.p1  ORF type:complete len:246 (-),score=36.16 TRINITY_DN2964_c0_g1_i1:156-857(-)